MAATYFNGLGAALAYGPGTKEFYTDKERLRAKYHYQKDQFDIDNMQAGEATAEVAGFWEGVKHTVADDAVFFEGKATAQEELSEIEKAKASAAQNVQDAVAYLNELDLADNIDLSLAPGQRQQGRVEEITESMVPMQTILAPDVLLSVGGGLALSGAFKMTSKVSKLNATRTARQAQLRSVDAQIKAGVAAQKMGTAAQQAQLAPAKLRPPSPADVGKLQRQKQNLKTEIAKLDKQIGRLDGTVPGAVASFVGATGRAVRSAPLRGGGAALQATGKVLQRIVGPGTAGVVGAIAGLPGGFVGSGIGAVTGTVLGLGTRGKTLTRLGEKMSRVGQELAQRRMVYPMHRKFAQEAKTNKLKQYHLGREAAYGMTVGLTSKLARLWRDVFIAELPFSYVAAGGFSQVGGNFLSQAAAESLLIEGPIVGATKLIGRAAGMQMSGNVKDHNRLAYNAALNFRDQFLTDPDQRKAFDALPPVVKRMYGNAFTNNPDLKIQFITDLEQGSGLYDPDTNTITVNPNDPRGVETILAHEFRHSMDMQGFSGAIIDAAVGPRGFLRQKPAEDSTTGIGELIPEFQEWAESLNEIRIKVGKEPFDLNTPEGLGEVVLEWSAYSSMDSIASGLRNNVLIEWSRRHPWMRSFYDSLMGRFFRQDSLMNAGLLFDQHGNLATQPGLPGMDALKAHPAISARLETMMKERAGIGFTIEERADFDDPDSKRKKPSPTAVRQGDKDALKEVEQDMHMDLKTNQAGNVVEVNGVAEVKPEPPPRELLPVLPDKDFDAPRVNEGRGTDNATDLTGALTASADPDADIIPGEESKLVRRDDNVEALKAHFREGYGYNDLQLGMIDDLLDIMSDPNRRGEAVLGYYFPVWKKERKKARKGNWMQYVPKRGIDPKWYRFVPYGLVQTDVGNVLVKAISMDQIILNAQTIAKSRRGLEVYGGDVGKIMDDFNEMVRNHGRNIQNASRFNPDKLALLNAVFGDVGRGHKEANLLLQNDPQIKKVRSAVRSFRIERFSQMNSGIKAGFPFSLEKTKAMEMPAQDPQAFDATRKQAGFFVGPLYHGTTKGFTVFDKPDLGYHLGTEKQATWRNERRGPEGEFGRFKVDKERRDPGTQIVKAYIKGENFLRLEDVGNWNDPGKVLEQIKSALPEFPRVNSLRAMAKELKAMGYDGVVYLNKFEGLTGGFRREPSGDSYIVFDANQIKSADPVTRDDQGNVIPLSRRFDTGDDIRGDVTGSAPGSRALEMPAEDPSVTVYHGGEAKSPDAHGGLFFVSPDKDQAVAYAAGAAEREMRPELAQSVHSFEINPKSIASEATAKAVLKQMMPNPLAGVWRGESIDHWNLHELLDGNFKDSFIGSQNRQDWIADMKKHGFSGAYFMDEDIRATGTGKTTQKNIVLFEFPSSTESKALPERGPGSIDARGHRSDLTTKLKSKIQGRKVPADQILALLSPKKGLVKKEEVAWLEVEDLIETLKDPKTGKVEVEAFLELLESRSRNLLEDFEMTDAGAAVIKINDVETFQATTVEDLQKTPLGVLGQDHLTRIAQGIQDLKDFTGRAPSALGDPRVARHELEIEPESQFYIFPAPRQGGGIPAWHVARIGETGKVEVLYFTPAGNHANFVELAAHHDPTWMGQEFVDQGSAVHGLRRHAERKRDEIYGPPPKWDSWTLPGGTRYTETVLRLNTQSMDETFTTTRARQYQARVHFGQDRLKDKAYGYIAHHRSKVRFHDEEPGLFLEELQSDRHQTGRKEGYRDTGNLPGQDGTEGRTSDAVPHAPFKDTTAWVLALFKSALNKAVAQDMEWIGWTDGDTQNLRNDVPLDTVLDWMRWDGENFNAATLDGTDIDEYVQAGDLANHVGEANARMLQEGLDAAEEYFNDEVTKKSEEYLEQYREEANLGSMPDLPEPTDLIPVSKEEMDAAQKARDDWEDQYREIAEKAYEDAYEEVLDYEGGPYAELSGDQIDGGGSGRNPEAFREFYDRTVVNVVNKHLKKYKLRAQQEELEGVTRSEDGEIPLFWKVEISEELRNDIKTKGQTRF